VTLSLLSFDPTRPTVPVNAVTLADVDGLAGRFGAPAAAWAATQGFTGAVGSILVLGGADGRPARVLFGIGDARDFRPPLLAGKLASDLPAGLYALEDGIGDIATDALAFALGAYRFDRYLKPRDSAPLLMLPAGFDRTEVDRLVAAVTLVRDLVNTPANDLGPEELAATARALAEAHGATVTEWVGDELAVGGFPLVAAVGAGSARRPRLVTFTWGREDAPKLSLVGKGVVFDSGGLDIKPGAGMRLMKKDMGGAAHVLALAQLIMGAGLDVRLRVVVPIVENSVSGSAFRPGDVYRSRKGLTVEIGDTDAEGRLILADAIAFADEEAPDLLVDLATLTGAARVALGPDLPPYYTHDETLAAGVAAASARVGDPSWRLPLWSPYDDWLKSKIADVGNDHAGNFAGSIVAALFLQRFVEKAASWLHADLFAWVPAARPGQPEGGEAQFIRALYAALGDRYGRKG
jgi:leucyl aminopeptidase